MKRRLGRPSTEQIAEGERRSRILAVATDHFGRRGYAAVALAEIADEVGVTKAALYHHFPSKNVLYIAMVTQLLGLIRDAIHAVAQQPLTTPDKLRRLAHMMVLDVPHEADRDGMLRDVAAHIAPEHQPAIHAGFAAIQLEFEAIMRDGVASGELQPLAPPMLAHAFQHLVSSFAGARGAAAQFPRDMAVADAAVDLFLHGAATTPPPPTDSQG